MRFLVKGPKQAPLHAYVKAWLNQQRLPSGIHMSIDVDPYSFF
jgi:primosomal protein N' (replication factor Y)